MSNHRRITLQEIAERAKVSTSTVSLTLNGKGSIAQETRDRILRIARELNYRRPSTASRKSKTIAVVVEELPVPILSDGFFRRVLSGLEMAASDRGFDVLLSVVRDGDYVQHFNDMVYTRQLDGMAIIGGGDLQDGFVRCVRETGVPLVLIDNYVVGEALPCILPDNLQGGYLATQYLIQLGHRRIGLIQGPTKYKTLTERLLGYIYALRDYGLDYDPSLVPTRTSHGQKKGYEEMRHLLRMPEPPTAVFAVSDKAAYGALRACSDLGIGVPEDVSLIGFDNLTGSQFQQPPLTTVETPMEELGTVAICRLAELIEGSDYDAAPYKMMLSTSLVERESCRPLLND